MQIIVQFSYPLFAIVLGVFIFIVAKRQTGLNRFVLWGSTIAYALVAIFVGITFQYPDSLVQVETVADVENTLINEKPTFVMLYSNY